MKKKISVCALAVIMSATAFAGCGGSNGPENTETNAIVQMYLGGFGTAGITALEQRFEEIYATEGYTVELHSAANLVGVAVTNNLQLGETITVTDLFLGGGFDPKPVVAQGASFLQDSDADCALEDLTSMYGELVYGENVTFAEKMYGDFAEFNKYGGKYWSSNWNAAVTGLLYNADYFTAKGVELPRTTDELIALADTIKGYGDIPFTFCGVAAYWEYCVLPWWRQFATDEEASDFWNCLDKNGEESPEAFKTQGRLQAYQILEDLVGDSSNFNSRALKDTNIEAQTRFFDGVDENGKKLWMMPSGSWTENEMALNGYQVGSKNIGLMRAPVSSYAIYRDIDRTEYRFETVRSDAKLSEVVKAVDEGKTEVDGVSAADFAAIKKMRSYVNTEGYASTAVIPSYANAKEVAKKFLLFMASDEAHQIYYDATKTYLPFDRSGVDIGANPTLFQRDVENIMKNVSFVSIHDSKNPIFYMTNMTFNSNNKFMDNAIATTEKSEKMTAAQWMEWIYNEVSSNFSTYQGLANSVR